MVKWESRRTKTNFRALRIAVSSAEKTVVWLDGLRNGRLLPLRQWRSESHQWRWLMKYALRASAGVICLERFSSPQRTTSRPASQGVGPSKEIGVAAGRSVHGCRRIGLLRPRNATRPAAVCEDVVRGRMWRVVGNRDESGERSVSGGIARVGYCISLPNWQSVKNGRHQRPRDWCPGSSGGYRGLCVYRAPVMQTQAYESQKSASVHSPITVG